MEHPCEKCGTQVEDGRPFCPNCGAPQVRVEMAPLDLESHPAPALRSSFPGYGAPGVGPRRSFARSAWQAGLLGVIANIIPFGLGMVLTGIVAGWIQQRAEGQKLETGRAAGLGAAAGAIAFGLTALITVVTVLVLHLQSQFRDLMLKTVEQRVGNPSDPQMQAAVQWLHTPEGFAIALVFSLFFALLVSMLFSAAGCMIVAALSRERKPPPF